MKSVIRRPLCLLLALVLLLSLLPGLRLPAAAAGVTINRTNFPDENFRSFVKQYDTNSDNSLSSAELAAVKSMDCSGKSIANLKGIEHFTSLIELNCSGNQLSALDLSRNTAVKTLWCHNNQLSALDLSKLTGLDSLWCHNNQLSALNLSKNTILTELHCFNNKLSTLDLSGNAALIRLNCYDNQLTSLKVGGCTVLEGLDCSGNRLTGLDLSKNYALDQLHCQRNQLKTLNLKANTALTRLNCYTNSLSALDLSKNKKLTYLICDKNSIKSLDLSANGELRQLICSRNQLTELDLSHNGELRIANCADNQLTKLELGKNKRLYFLCCEKNGGLTKVDLAWTPLLREVYLHGDREDKTNYYVCSQGTHCFSADKRTMVETEYYYPLKICGVNVSEANRGDILGNGVFSFDGGRLLTVNGICETDRVIIDNVGVENLRIKVSKNSKLSTTNNNVILARANTVITGPARLLLTCSYDHGTGIHAYGSDVTLRIEEADLRVEAYFGINGSFQNESSSKLIVNHSTVETDAPGGGIFDFPGGITLQDVKIVKPVGGKLHENGKSIVTASYGLADTVTLVPTVRSNPFTDVPGNKYYCNPALWAYYRKPRITSGTTATSFGPGKECKREQVMTFLWKAAGAPEPETDSCPFTDVPKNKYYYKPIVWAVENSITGGVSSTKFGVGKACSRAQVVTFLWKFAGAPEPLGDDCPFTDVPSTKYYYKPVLWALENGITSGTSSTSFGVSKTCTRAQVVTFLYKLMVG